VADQKRWFKLWDSATGDDALQTLPPAVRWAWAALGAYTKMHGTNGRVTISQTNAVLAAKMGVSPDALLVTVRMLPNVVIHGRIG